MSTTDHPTTEARPMVHHPPHKEGSRHHVVWWSGGLPGAARRHCSERDCEVNRDD